ncbi:MAG: hypothetical protein V8R08_02255 [Coriobacteriales bacterium]
MTSTQNDGVRSRVAIETDATHPSRLIADKSREKRQRKALKKNRHKATKVAFFRYGYYEPAFRFFTERVLDAEFLPLPTATRQTIELGERLSTDYVCTPFKHILGDYIEALDQGANVLVQFAGPCRLGYYGELQESILRDAGYDFVMLNFSEHNDQGPLGWAKDCLKKVNPDINIPHAVMQLMATANMATKLDGARDYYLANAGFEVEHGSFARVWDCYMDDLNAATCDADINEAYNRCMEAMRDLPIDKPANPIRIGIVGELFTAFDERSNLNLDEKLLKMHVEIYRYLNLTHRFIHYNEPNLRVSAGEYLLYDMGPTSTMTVGAARRYAERGFDGIIHAKSAGCTPEIDCEPVLQRISSDFRIPTLYLTYDAQTSDTGLDTRLEAFYDMLAMKKESRS